MNYHLKVMTYIVKMSMYLQLISTYFKVGRDNLNMMNYSLKVMNKLIGDQTKNVEIDKDKKNNKKHKISRLRGDEEEQASKKVLLKKKRLQICSNKNKEVTVSLFIIKQVFTFHYF